MSGESLTRDRLKNWIANPAVQTVYLLGLGFLAVLLQDGFRLPLQLHGRHGMEWMALVLVGRLSVGRSWSGTTVSLGAAGFSLLPVWSFKDPLMPLLFLLPGIIIDLAFNRLQRWQESILFLVIVGGLAHLSKPLIRAGAAASLGLSYGFLKEGLLYSIALHFVFGAIGGFIAYLYVLGKRGLSGGAAG